MKANGSLANTTLLSKVVRSRDQVLQFEMPTVVSVMKTSLLVRINQHGIQRVTLSWFKCKAGSDWLNAHVLSGQCQLINCNGCKSLDISLLFVLILHRLLNKSLLDQVLYFLV